MRKPKINREDINHWLETYVRDKPDKTRITVTRHTLSQAIDVIDRIADSGYAITGSDVDVAVRLRNRLLAILFPNGIPK